MVTRSSSLEENSCKHHIKILTLQNENSKKEFLQLTNIVFIGILMIYQGIRNKRVSERISHSCKKDGTNCKGGEGTYTEIFFNHGEGNT